VHLNLSSSLILEHRGVVAQELKRSLDGFVVTNSLERGEGVRARAHACVALGRCVRRQFRRGPPRKWLDHTVASQRMVFHPSVNTSTEYSHVTGLLDFCACRNPTRVRLDLDTCLDPEG